MQIWALFACSGTGVNCNYDAHDVLVTWTIFIFVQLNPSDFHLGEKPLGRLLFSAHIYIWKENHSLKACVFLGLLVNSTFGDTISLRSSNFLMTKL